VVDSTVGRDRLLEKSLEQCQQSANDGRDVVGGRLDRYNWPGFEYPTLLILPKGSVLGCIVNE
jgi:hypothetical protein